MPKPPQFDPPNASNNVSFWRDQRYVGGNRSMQLGAKLRFWPRRDPRGKCDNLIWNLPPEPYYRGSPHDGLCMSQTF